MPPLGLRKEWQGVQTERATLFKLTFNNQIVTFHLPVPCPEECRVALVLWKAPYLCGPRETATTQTPFLLFAAQCWRVWLPSAQSKCMKKTMPSITKDQACMLQWQRRVGGGQNLDVSSPDDLFRNVLSKNWDLENKQRVAVGEGFS